MISAKCKLKNAKLFDHNFELLILQFAVCTVCSSVDFTQDDIDAADHSYHIGNQAPFDHLWKSAQISE
jgi:hypothetical protein